MHNESKIHLVARRELQSARNTASREGSALAKVGDIVRETLTVARECSEALAGSDLRKDQLLIELIASVVVVRLRKAGAQ
jgi:polysaccharide deacetylase 2 family uncharacterized protein YibQ